LKNALSASFAIPFFGHGTMERVIEHGEVVTAKTRACLLSSIPQASLGNRVVLLDLHSGGIPHYFEGALRPDHITALPIVVDVVKSLKLKDFVMACTDAGRAKWVQNLANDLGVSASFVFKKRVSGSKTEVIAMNADVKGRPVVIYDDMIRSGSSLIKAAKAYKSAGAAEIIAIATHGVLPGGALQDIRASGLFREVIVTDSHPRARQLADGFLKVMPVAGLLAGHLTSSPIKGAL
jgi:ribose-phosphate pyrophosphokinase